MLITDTENKTFEAKIGTPFTGIIFKSITISSNEVDSFKGKWLGYRNNILNNRFLTSPNIIIK